MEETNAPAHAAPVVQAPKTSKGVWEFVRFIVTVVVIVVAVRFFIAQPFVVSGTSMLPTFQDKNYLIVDELSYHFHQPHRGDVIVFKPPYDSSIYLIKRVIGLPGETVTAHNGVITITNKEHPEGFILNEPYLTPDLPDDNFSKTVPDGQYFVMGDNRPVSYDSRRWGTLPAKEIAGRALLRLFPFNEIAVLPGEHVSY